MKSKCERREARGDQGFILPMCVLLIVLLGVSGMSFLNLGFLELRRVMNELGNHRAFYLANAGIERSRESFKIPDSLSWTSIINGGDTDRYPIDDNPDPLLCPGDPADPNYRGCVIPPFQSSVANAGILDSNGDPIIASNGDPVKSPDMPFTGSFDTGFYHARAFNNEGSGDVGKTDGDQSLVVRALGNVFGEVKVLEAQIRAVSGLKMINCLGDAAAPCPNRINGIPTIDPMEGREPASSPELPHLTFPLSNPENYYRQPVNFPGLIVGDYQGTIENNHYYYILGDVEVQNMTASNVVIFSTGKLTVKTNTVMDRAILIGVNKVEFKGSGEIRAPLPYPAVISEGDVTKSSGSATVFGTIYAGGTIDFNPIDVHGVLIGDRIEIQGSSVYTDDAREEYYDLMPGFTYPDDLKTTVLANDSWREVQ